MTKPQTTVFFDEENRYTQANGLQDDYFAEKKTR